LANHLSLADRVRLFHATRRSALADLRRIQHLLHDGRDGRSHSARAHSHPDRLDIGRQCLGSELALSFARDRLLVGLLLVTLPLFLLFFFLIAALLRPLLIVRSLARVLLLARLWRRALGRAVGARGGALGWG